MDANLARQRIAEICADLLPLGAPMDEQQLRQRAQVIHAALLARRRMQTLRDRAAGLNDALARFHSRREEIAQRAAISGGM